MKPARQARTGPPGPPAGYPQPRKAKAPRKGDRGRGRRSTSGWPSAGRDCLVAGVLMVLPVLALIRISPQTGTWPLAAGFALMSVITWSAISRDKRQAETGGWRTPESTLHLLELCGGWPASFLAQRYRRHKTVKTSYQVVFFAIVVLHQLAAADYISGWRFSRMLFERAGLH